MGSDLSVWTPLVCPSSQLHVLSQSTLLRLTPSPPGLLSSSKRPLGGSSGRGRSRKVVRRGGLKKGTAGAPMYSTESTGQKDRHTFFSRHAPTTDRHDTEAHISSIFPLSLPTRILSIQITQTARSTHVPQPRARTPHRRSADSARRRAEPSLLSGSRRGEPGGLQSMSHRVRHD